MSGSWNHIVNDDGTPQDDRFGIGAGRSLENDGDILECIEEMYGMIWYLANWIAGDRVIHYTTREDVLSVISEAQEFHQQGLEQGQSGR